MAEQSNTIHPKAKETMVRLLKDGQSTEKVVKRYRGRYSKRQVAALLGHINMGNL